MIDDDLREEILDAFGRLLNDFIEFPFVERAESKLGLYDGRVITLSISLSDET